MLRAQSLVRCGAGAAAAEGRPIPMSGCAWTGAGEDAHARGEPSAACCPPWPWPALLSSYRLVEEGGDILLLVPVGRTEHHHSILRVEMTSQGLRLQRT